MPVRAALAVVLIGFAASATASERNPAPPKPNPCAKHGPGFEALPGTTTCLRLGGGVRGEMDARATASGAADRARLNAEARAALDSRTDTDGGPLRAVVQVRGRRGEPSR